MLIITVLSTGNTTRSSAGLIVYYELNDGRILLVLGFGNGSGTIYDSEKEFKEAINQPDVRKEGEHVLNNLIMAIKKIELIAAPPAPHMVGDGFRVHNFIPSAFHLDMQRMTPFIMLDYNLLEIQM